MINTGSYKLTPAVLFTPLSNLNTISCIRSLWCVIHSNNKSNTPTIGSRVLSVNYLLHQEGVGINLSRRGIEEYREIVDYTELEENILSPISVHFPCLQRGGKFKPETAILRFSQSQKEKHIACWHILREQYKQTP